MIPCELYLSHILIKLHLYEWKPLANAQVNSIDLLNFLQDRPTLFIVFNVIFIINLFCVSAEKSCNFGDVHRAPSSHPNLETKLKCDENKMARQWDVYSLDPVNIPRPRPQIHLHPHSLLYTYVSPNWVNRPTNNDMEKIPLRPLHCSAQTPSARAQRSREGPQIPARRWMWRRKGDLEVLHSDWLTKYNLIKDGRLQPLTFDSLHYFFVQTKGPGIVLCDCALSLLKAGDLIPGSVTTTTARHPSDFAIPPTCGLLG